MGYEYPHKYGCTIHVMARMVYLEYLRLKIKVCRLRVRDHHYLMIR